MSAALEALVEQLGLERLEDSLFRGQSRDLGWGRVFGGQVLGQALSAAVQTVPDDRRVHSLHSYFLRPGDVSRPIIYEVDRIRDGRSFTTRRVVAIQKGEAIFNMSTSFQKHEEGFDHQDGLPSVPEPESLETEQAAMAKIADKLPAFLRERALGVGPFEMRPVEPDPDPFAPVKGPSTKMVWLRATGELPDDPGLHRYLLAYASDAGFVTTALKPHGVNTLTPGLQVASLDHAMWFHRPLRIDDWLLYAMDSPSAHGGRGLARGSIFNRKGELVVSTAQEGLLRLGPKA
jgi:acyl-CoA thioesterase-2